METTFLKETTIVKWGYIGIMEKKIETTIVYWGYIAIMEKKMETTIVYWGYIGIMVGPAAVPEQDCLQHLALSVPDDPTTSSNMSCGPRATPNCSCQCCISCQVGARTSQPICLTGS